MDIRIRPAQNSDSSAISALLSQIVEVHYAVRPDIFRPCPQQESSDFCEDADAPVFVAVDEQENVVGCLWCVISRQRDNSMKADRDWLVIDDLCVDARCRRKGIGRKLVDFAVRFARREGLPRIELNVYEDNLGAVKFYERYGFKIQKRVMELDVSSRP